MQEKAHGYEKITNSKIGLENNSCPKMSFDTCDYFNESQRLSLEKPLWKNEGDNPIYHYVPDTTLRHTKSTQFLVDSRLKKDDEFDEASKQKADLFQTTFKKEDCFETKRRLAKNDPIRDVYVTSHEHIFRNLMIPLNQTDFKVSRILYQFIVKIQMCSCIQSLRNIRA